MFNVQTWAAVPFYFWSLVLFVFGTIVGSFLNVCIHRLPRDESLISPPSHCPHCHYAIPWYLNIPLFTWVWLRGRCANCGAPISVRYFVVELTTGLAFLGAWLAFGHASALLALGLCCFFSVLLVASLIDLEHFIIPDEITLGGMALGFLLSALVPGLHRVGGPLEAMRQSLLGALVGAGIMYAIVRIGKWFLGRQSLALEPGSRVVFSETSIQLPDKEVAYEELFYRRSDAIQLQATSVELILKCAETPNAPQHFENVAFRLSPQRLEIGDQQFDPETVGQLEVVTDAVVLPREAMGLGDVKFMGCIGAFLGWQAVLFSLMLSAVLGSLVGVTLIALRRREWSSRIPYGPYIALAAIVWSFGGYGLWTWWWGG